MGIEIFFQQGGTKLFVIYNVMSSHYLQITDVAGKAPLITQDCPSSGPKGKRRSAASLGIHEKPFFRDPCLLACAISGIRPWRPT